MAPAVQTPLQPTSTESGIGWSHSCRGGTELNGIQKAVFHTN
jgi:hypothetical protein